MLLFMLYYQFFCVRRNSDLCWFLFYPAMAHVWWHVDQAGEGDAVLHSTGCHAVRAEHTAQCFVTVCVPLGCVFPFG